MAEQETPRSPQNNPTSSQDMSNLAAPSGFPKGLQKDPTSSDDIIKEFVKANSYSIQKSALSNGSQLLTVDIKTPLTFVGVAFKAGSRYEKEGEHGALHFFEHLVPSSYSGNDALRDTLSKRFGGDPLPKLLNQMMEERGWNYTIAIDRDNLVVGFTSPSYDTGHAIALLAGILNGPIDAYRAAFELEKSRIKNEIDLIARQQNEQKTNFIIERTSKNAGEKHPIGGTVESVSTYIFEHVWKIGKRFLVPENATYLYVGAGPISNQHLEGISNIKLFTRAQELEAQTPPPPPPTVPVTSSTEPAPPFYTREGYGACGFSAFTVDIKNASAKEILALQLIATHAQQRINNELSHTRGLLYGVPMWSFSLSEGNSVRVFILSNDAEKLIQAAPVVANLCAGLHTTLDEKTLNKILTQTKARLTHRTVSVPNIINELLGVVATPELPHIPMAEEYRLLQSLTLGDLQSAAKKLFGTVERPKGQFTYWVPAHELETFEQHRAVLTDPWKRESPVELPNL